MSICGKGRNFVSSAREDHFVSASQRIVEQIRNSLFPDAEYVNPSRNMDCIFRSGRSLIASRDTRVIELQEEDLLELINYRYGPGELKGIYTPYYGKLFLNSRLWCLETFIHEILHSLSISSRNSTIFREYLQFFEGLTELYTGYILREHYDFCYDNCWRTNTDSRCYCTYQREVRLWLGICHFVPLKLTFPLYFWSGEDRWEVLWRSFIQEIRDRGYPRFDTIIDQDKKPKWLALHQEARKRFGREYLDIYDDVANPLDLSLLNEQ